jgi:hypothetical protein
MKTLGDYTRSRYMKAEDLDVSPVTLEIAAIEENEVGRDNETKLCMAFVGQRKSLILNATNLNTLKKLFGKGATPERLIGERVTLVTREIDYGGETYNVIRISGIRPPGRKKEYPPLEEEFRSKEEDAF